MRTWPLHIENYTKLSFIVKTERRFIITSIERT
nr:MAG TPA: hypothetical protein [Caudoviricetes sp.]